MHLCFVPIPLLLVYLRMRISTLKQCWSVRGPLRECRSIWANRFWATLLLRTTCMRLCWTWVASCVLLCFIDPRVRKIRNEVSSCPGIFSRTLYFYYVASSPGSPLPHLLDRHRKLVGYSAIPARSYPGPVRYHWGRKYRRVGSASRRNARIEDTPPPQHQRITKHHIW